MADRKTKPCGRPIIEGTGKAMPTLSTVETRRCGYFRMYGKQQCMWHWLLNQPADVCKRFAERRLQDSDAADRVRRVSRDRCPEGERWCAGCQSFVPLFYTSGSRCKSCASSASHEAMVQRTYGLEPGEYDALLKLQGGRCYICGRRSPSRRLAVDHDHETGQPRGLLCPDPERGCNHKVLGPLEANSVDGGLPAARRLVDYLEDPPYARLRRGQTAPTAKTWGSTEPRSLDEAFGGVGRLEPPF